MSEPTAPAEQATPSPKPAETNLPADSKVFTQEEVSKIVAKELKPFKEMKSEYEKLIEERKQKETAELSELDKLKKERDELLGFKTKSEELSGFFKEMLDEKITAIPENLKHRVPEGLTDYNLLNWLNKNPDLFSTAQTNGLSPPASGGKPQTGTADPIREKAKERMKVFHPAVSETLPDGKQNPKYEEFISRFIGELRMSKPA